MQGNCSFISLVCLPLAPRMLEFLPCEHSSFFGSTSAGFGAHRRSPLGSTVRDDECCEGEVVGACFEFEFSIFDGSTHHVTSRALPSWLVMTGFEHSRGRHPDRHQQVTAFALVLLMSEHCE